MRPNLISYRSKLSIGQIGAQCSFWFTSCIKLRHTPRYEMSSTVGNTTIIRASFRVISSPCCERSSIVGSKNLILCTTATQNNNNNNNNNKRLVFLDSSPYTRHEYWRKQLHFYLTHLRNRIDYICFQNQSVQYRTRFWSRSAQLTVCHR